MENRINNQNNETHVHTRSETQDTQRSQHNAVITVDNAESAPPDDSHREQYFSFPHSHQPALRSSEQPPTYEEVIDINAPPPSYDSLFGRVREVRKTSNGVIDFIKNLFLYILGKSKTRLLNSTHFVNICCLVGLMIMIGLTIVAPVSMLVIGSIYFSDCPAEPYIPIYLIVGGACGLLKQILTLKIRSERSTLAETEVPDSSCTASVQSLLNSFLICWFITGCYWVYRAYEPVYDDPEHGKRYCSYVLYSFAFWLLTSTYVFAGIVVLLLCLLSFALIGREN